VSLVGITGLLAYLGAVVWYDARGERPPLWCSAAALASAFAVAATSDGIGARDALIGAAVGTTLLGLAALAHGASRAELALALVAGAWLGPAAVVHGTALGAATVVLAVLVHGAATQERLSLATTFAAVRGRRRDLAVAPLPLVVPLAAGYAAAAVLAVTA
jgi:hypothetical protein